MNQFEYRAFVNSNRHLFEKYADTMLSESSYEGLEAMGKVCTAEIVVLLTEYKRNLSIDDAMEIALRIFGEEVMPIVKTKSDYYSRLYGYTQSSPNRSINSYRGNNHSNWSTSVRENYYNDDSLKVGGIISLVVGIVLGIISISSESGIVFIIAIFFTATGIVSINEYNKKK